jgi:hypothetical protein
MRLGHGQRRAVLILWTWTALLSAAVLIPVYTGSGLGFVPLAVAALALLLYTLVAPGWQARRSGNGDEIGGARAAVQAGEANGHVAPGAPPPPPPPADPFAGTQRR